jgi:biopolymer transport protein ExbB
MITSIIDFFVRGGIFMIPLVLLSLISLTFILERAFALRRTNLIQENLKEAIDLLKTGDNISEIEHLASNTHTTLSRLVAKCINHLSWAKAENVEALQTAARSEIVKMERGLVILEITVGVGPLLGLLGTVSGLVAIFSSIGDAGLATQGMLLARGISEALNTTVAGLVIAIPSLIAHSYYTKKIDSIAAELESICMDLLLKVYAREEETVP